MSTVTALLPMGNTVLAAATASASAGVQVAAVNATVSADTFYIVNSSSTLVAFVAFGATAGAAQSACVIPTGTSQAVIAIPPNTGLSVKGSPTTPTGPFVSAITTAAGPANVYVTPIEGI